MTSYLAFLDKLLNICSCKVTNESSSNLICKSNYYLLKNKIKVIHLSDNNGVEDEHSGILKGNLTSQELKIILSLKPEFLVLEMNLNDVEESLDILKSNYFE